jgi:2-amino-4-hydroxy-6-hydroxymethyldihydropteridine diphosphokinase
MATALISLGSNVGDRAAALRQSLELLASAPGVRVTATSSFHETSPAGGPASQEKFINAAALLETDLPPLGFLSMLQNVEQQLGRVRTERWGPRTIDLDLLLYDQLELETPELTLPHPRMSFRRFVLEPAAEIAADMVHPVCGNTIAGLLRHLDQSPRYLAIEGLNPAVLAALRKNLRFIVTFEKRASRSYASEPPLLLQAISELEHDQWLVGDAWGGSAVRFLVNDSGNLERSRKELSDLVQPKLLIVLPGAGPAADIRDKILGMYRGPVLWLRRADAALVTDEVLAASAAME